MSCAAIADLSMAELAAISGLWDEVEKLDRRVAAMLRRHNLDDPEEREQAAGAIECEVRGYDAMHVLPMLAEYWKHRLAHWAVFAQLLRAKTPDEEDAHRREAARLLRLAQAAHPVLVEVRRRILKRRLVALLVAVVIAAAVFV